MSYLESKHVQAWLKESKFAITTVDAELETQAAAAVFGKLGQRYDTSTWLDGASTPVLVLSIIGMGVAEAELRKTISEDDGEASYPNWLAKRLEVLCDGIVSGDIALAGVDPSTETTLGSVPLFSPTDASTTLAESDPHAEGATPLAFSMQTVF